MIIDIEGLLSDLGDALFDALRGVDEGRPIHVEKVRVEGPVTVTTHVSARFGLLEGLGQGGTPRRPIRREPLIEVLDDRRGMRVIVLLPGIRKEDVKVYSLKRALRIEIEEGGIVHRKDIPCDSPPRRIEVSAVNLNNSVIEIIFSGTKKGGSL